MPTSTVSEPRDLSEALGAAVAAASAEGRPLRIVGGDTKAFLGRPTAGETLGLAGHRGVVAYEPGELVVTARAGTPLSDLEALLEGEGQMLAFEPPRFGPRSTLGGVVAAGLSGARRPFAGAVRDSLLGARILNGRGEALRFGGTVFKNVAGFDAFRLMAGALGCLGVLLEVSLRVAPKPEEDAALVLEEAWPVARTRLVALMRRPVPLSGAVHDGTRLHLRLSGPRNGVRTLAREIGGEAEGQGFWDGLRDRSHPIFEGERLWRLSVPMTSETTRIEALAARLRRDWAGAEIWLASAAPAAEIRAAAAAAGGHATLFRGAAQGEAVFEALAPPLLALHRRLKRAFDPAGVFNPGRMYQEL